MSFHKSILELSISGRHFLRKDNNKIDPQCIVHMRTICDKKHTEIGRTEVIRGSRDPNWTIKVPLVYAFNELQLLRLEVWDYDLCADNELLGQIEISVGTIVAHKGVIKKRLKLDSEDNKFTVTGELWITADETLPSKQIVDIEFQARNLTRKDFLGSSDPYLIISKEDSESFIQVYKSEVIYNTLDPKWTPFSVRVQELCDADYDKQIKIDCFDWDKHKTDDYIGSLKTTLNDLYRSHQTQRTVFELFNSKQLDTKARRKSMRNNCGVLSLKSLAIRQTNSFYDYVHRETQLHFMAAIDFTHDSIWYHHVDHNVDKTNNIELVIRSLGGIIQRYDYQGLHAAYGFGAKVLPRRELSHNFNININSILPYCDGVDDIISCYRSVLRAIEPDNSRHFATVINHVSHVTKNFQDGKHYFVLTVVTSGSNADTAETIEAIVSSSAMPISIIFVGIGNSAFNALKGIDGDAMTSKGQRTWRNNVQFALLRNYTNQSLSVERMEKMLAEDLLKAIPQQMLEFMDSRNYLPK